MAAVMGAVPPALHIVMKIASALENRCHQLGGLAAGDVNNDLHLWLLSRVLSMLASEQLPEGALGLTTMQWSRNVGWQLPTQAAIA